MTVNPIRPTEHLQPRHPDSQSLCTCINKSLTTSSKTQASTESTCSIFPRSFCAPQLIFRGVGISRLVHSSLGGLNVFGRCTFYSKRTVRTPLRSRNLHFTNTPATPYTHTPQRLYDHYRTGQFSGPFPAIPYEIHEYGSCSLTELNQNLEAVV